MARTGPQPTEKPPRAQGGQGHHAGVNADCGEAAVAEYKAKTPDALQLGGGANSNTGQNTGSRGGVEDKLQELNTKATAAKTERMRLEGELAQIEQAGDNITVSPRRAFIAAILTASVRVITLSITVAPSSAARIFSRAAPNRISIRTFALSGARSGP